LRFENEDDDEDDDDFRRRNITMSDLIQQMVKERRDVEEHTSNGDASTQAVLERLTAAEQRVRVTLEHSVNAPMTFELGADELNGRTLTETIETLLQRTDPLTANSIRQTLSDPAALIEVHQGESNRPARPDERIDTFIAQGEVSLGVSRSMRGG
jgi:hypothetical protein